MPEFNLAVLLLLAIAAAGLALAWRAYFQLAAMRAELASYAERVAALPIRRPRGRPPVTDPKPATIAQRKHRKKQAQATLALAPEPAAPASAPVDNLSTAAG
jgi:hypothetical protein